MSPGPGLIARTDPVVILGKQQVGQVLVTTELHGGSMSGFIDDFDDDETMPIHTQRTNPQPPFDDFDDDETMPAAHVQAIRPSSPPADDFNDDNTVPTVSITRPPAPTQPHAGRTLSLQPVPPTPRPQSIQLAPPASSRPWTPPQRPTTPPAAIATAQTSWVVKGIAALAVIVVVAIVLILFVFGGTETEAAATALLSSIDSR